MLINFVWYWFFIIYWSWTNKCQFT